MYELVISNLAFHSLATLALVAVFAASSLRAPRRRRSERTYAVAAAKPALIARTERVAEQLEDQAEAA